MIKALGNQKSSTRLEFHYSTLSKVMIGVVGPIIFGAFGAWGLWMAIDHTDPDDIFMSLLIAGFFGYFFFLVLFKIPIIFSSKPQIIIDETGITDNQRWKTLTIPWDDIEWIEFPYRYVSRSVWRRVLSIRFKKPHPYNSRVPFLYRLNKRLTPNAGDYEISLYHFDGTASDAYSYIKRLQKNKQIPNFWVGRLDRDKSPWGTLIIIALILLVIYSCIRSMYY